MANITERLAYRIAGFAWTAIYARLCSSASSPPGADINVDAAMIGAGVPVGAELSVAA